MVWDLDQGTGVGGGYVPLFQCYGGVAWALCVSRLQLCFAAAIVRDVTPLFLVFVASSSVSWLTILPLHRKWFLKALGVQQFHKLLAGFEDKSAQAVCTFAYCEGPDEEVIVFQGRTEVSRLARPCDEEWRAASNSSCRVKLLRREDQRTLVSCLFRAEDIRVMLIVLIRMLVGWDACFEYQGQTYAEMRGEEKNKISHRGKALDKLKEWLKQETA